MVSNRRVGSGFPPGGPRTWVSVRCGFMTAPAICVPQYSLSTTDALRMSIQVCSTARECCAGGHDHETCLGGKARHGACPCCDCDAGVGVRKTAGLAASCIFPVGEDSASGMRTVELITSRRDDRSASCALSWRRWGDWRFMIGLDRRC
jgi:hypothetical protein